jgi:hypothetical protein
LLSHVLLVKFLVGRVLPIIDRVFIITRLLDGSLDLLNLLLVILIILLKTAENALE